MDCFKQSDSSKANIPSRQMATTTGKTPLMDYSEQSDSSKPDDYLHKFLNTNFDELAQSDIDHIALVLKQNNLINDDDWCKKTQLKTKSLKPESFFWRIYCLLHNPETAKSTYDILLNCLYSCNITLAHNLQHVSPTHCSNYNKELDNIEKIAALIELGKTDKVMWCVSHGNLVEVEELFKEYSYTKCKEKLKEDFFLLTKDREKLNIMWFGGITKEK